MARSGENDAQQRYMCRRCVFDREDRSVGDAEINRTQFRQIYIFRQFNLDMNSMIHTVYHHNIEGIYCSSSFLSRVTQPVLLSHWTHGEIDEERKSSFGYIH